MANNTGHNNQAPEETADGISRIVSVVRARCPEAQILLLGVFPRGQQPDDPKRKLNVEINKIIAKLGQTKNVHFLDIGDKFIEKDGSISKNVMPDALHLTADSYQIWADAIEPKLKEFGL